MSGHELKPITLIATYILVEGMTEGTHWPNDSVILPCMDETFILTHRMDEKRASQFL
jgi:hypothetical protein